MKMQCATIPSILEQKLFGTPITYAPWSAYKVREELPDVQVNHNGSILDCRVAGRLNSYATVFSSTGSAFPRWQFSWEAIANSLNSGRPLNG